MVPLGCDVQPGGNSSHSTKMMICRFVCEDMKLGRAGGSVEFFKRNYLICHYLRCKYGVKTGLPAED